MSKTKKKKEITLKDAKLEAARLGLEVNNKYDKRFINTWLYTIGKDVKPVERKQIVHVAKKEKPVLSMAELILLAGEKNDSY